MMVNFIPKRFCMLQGLRSTTGYLFKGRAIIIKNRYFLPTALFQPFFRFTRNGLMGSPHKDKDMGTGKTRSFCSIYAFVWGCTCLFADTCWHMQSRKAKILSKACLSAISKTYKLYYHSIKQSVKFFGPALTASEI
ncbi:MAG: hypothetical protein DRH24_04445 [Deltaproteobacteria bacterium]|nr:MAG: hypothetical protein DRH24_04445 [Deltaproteobacteria bacterium]